MPLPASAVSLASALLLAAVMDPAAALAAGSHGAPQGSTSAAATGRDGDMAASAAQAMQGAGPAPAVNPLSLPQPAAASGEALLLVEIPAGSATKYETLPNGLVHVDRFLQMPVAYPANYGALPSTLAGDGDPLDALVLTRQPLPPGVLLRFRPVAVLRMIDGGAPDQKLIGVPADDVDPAYAHVRDLDDLPATDRQRIEAFFRVYKQLPDSDAGKVELGGWGDAAEARALLEESRLRYLEVPGDKGTR